MKRAIVLLGLGIALSGSVFAKQTLKEGAFVCEDKWYQSAAINVRQHPTKANKIILRVNDRDRILHAEPTRSGALRYEGAVSRLLYIQTPSHSVLLDNNTMKQIYNDCEPK